MLKKLGLILLLFISSSFAFAQGLGRPEEASHELERGSTNDPIIQAVIVKALPQDLKNTKVIVRNGVAYVSGILNSNTDYKNLINIVESTPGVSNVNTDKLTVNESKHPIHDTYITAKIKGALLVAKDVPSSLVHVETHDGTVYLSGMIRTSPEKQNILQVVKSIQGIKNIKDSIVITGER